jgi:antitoxin component of RelBE/YafQ-DinJ toxin-antitoxin module
MARDSRVSIKVTKEVKMQMENIALSYGLTKSSLGAFIIGQWLKDNSARLPGVTADNCRPGVPL